MKNVLIVGTGGMAKVYYDILKDSNGVYIIGFADDNESKKDKKYYGKKIYVPISIIKEKFTNLNEKYFVVTIGNTRNRRNIFSRVKSYGFKPINVIHKNSYISTLAKIGVGNLIEAGVGINPGVEIGDNCIISLNASIGHDVKIGDNVHIAPNVSLGGNAVLNDCVDMGLNSCVLPNVRIGKNTVIGAGAVVVEDIPENVVAVGVPARVVKKISD